MLAFSQSQTVSLSDVWRNIVILDILTGGDEIMEVPPKQTAYYFNQAHFDVIGASLVDESVPCRRGRGQDVTGAVRRRVLQSEG